MPIFERSAISRSSTPTASRICRRSGPVNSVCGGQLRHRRAGGEVHRVVRLPRAGTVGPLPGGPGGGVTGIGTPSGNSSRS